MIENNFFIINGVISLALIIFIYKTISLIKHIKELHKALELIQKHVSKIYSELILLKVPVKKHENTDLKSAAKLISEYCTNQYNCNQCPFRQQDGLCVLSINEDGETNGFTPDTWNIN